jgi:hypothetical protein
MREHAMSSVEWRKSSYSNASGGACVELGWRKSSHSNGSGGTCVELAYAGAIRDSKNPSGPSISVTQAALASFVEYAKHLNS